MLNLMPEKELLFPSNSLNIHGVTKIQVSHEPGYTQIELLGETGLIIRLFHEAEGDIPLNLIVVKPEAPPPAPVEEFPIYPLT